MPKSPEIMVQSGSKNKKIIQFYRRNRYWLLDYARIFAEGYRLEGVPEDERNNITINSGFAMLTILNALLDLMGLLIGDDKYLDETKPRKEFECWEKKIKGNDKVDHRDPPSAELRVYIGLSFFFADCLPAKCKKPYKLYYESVRSGIAHVAFPSQIILHNNENVRLELNQPLTVVQDTKIGGELSIFIAIHRVLWYQRISQRFDQYIGEIRDPQTEDARRRRERFLERIDHIR